MYNFEKKKNVYISYLKNKQKLIRANETIGGGKGPETSGKQINVKGQLTATMKGWQG